MYDKQLKPSADKRDLAQLAEGSEEARTPAGLRGMSYAEGQAHLAPAVQQKATEDEESEGDKQKLLALVQTYVDTTFGGDMQRAFGHYAKEDVVDKAGVTRMLEDAGVKDAFGFLKWLAIPGLVMKHFDTNGDGAIDAAEFDKGLESES